MIENASSVKEVIESVFSKAVSVVKKIPVSGGDINTSFVLELSGGYGKLFLKTNSPEFSDMFAGEAAGLSELKKAAAGISGICVPEPFGYGRDGNLSFLILEYIETGGRIDGFGFGSAFAEFHKNAFSYNCGFYMDNRIGYSIQKNDGENLNWIDFFAGKRLGFQWKLASEKGYINRNYDVYFERFINRLDSLIPDVEEGRFSLLHGDLWGGNWIPGADGTAWLIDPAVYYGHRETDIAMTKLFGGFPAGFYSGYNSSWPLEPGFSERVDIYNLYHLLNHLNLFGEGYLGSVLGIIKRYGG